MFSKALVIFVLSFSCAAHAAPGLNSKPGQITHHEIMGLEDWIQYIGSVKCASAPEYLDEVLIATYEMYKNTMTWNHLKILISHLDPSFEEQLILDHQAICPYSFFDALRRLEELRLLRENNASTPIGKIEMFKETYEHAQQKVLEIDRDATSYAHALGVMGEDLVGFVREIHSKGRLKSEDTKKASTMLDRLPRIIEQSRDLNTQIEVYVHLMDQALSQAKQIYEVELGGSFGVQGWVSNINPFSKDLGLKSATREWLSKKNPYTLSPQQKKYILESQVKFIENLKEQIEPYLR